MILLLDLFLSNLNIDINEKYFYKFIGECYEIAPIHIALFKCYKEIFNLLIKHPKIDVNSRYLLQSKNNASWRKKINFMDLTFIDSKIIKEKGTALHIAFREMNLEIIQILLSHRNININESMVQIAENEQVDHLTPLHLAVSERNIQITRLLLSHQKINVNTKLDKIINKSKIKNPNIFILGCTGCRSYNCFLNTKILNDKNLLEIRGITALHLAIIINKLDIVKLLMKKSNIDINETMLIKLKNGEKTGITALDIAIEMKELEYVKILLEHHNININSILKIKYLQNMYEVTPLHYATVINNKKIVNKLFLAGANFL